MNHIDVIEQINNTFANICWCICCDVKNCIWGAGVWGGAVGCDDCVVVVGIDVGCCITFGSWTQVNGGGGGGKFVNNSVCSASFCIVVTTLFFVAVVVPVVVVLVSTENKK